MRREKRVEYIVVERSGEDQVQEVESSRITATPTPTTFISQRQANVYAQPTGLQVRHDGDDDDDDDDKKPPVVRDSS